MATDEGKNTKKGRRKAGKETSKSTATETASAATLTMDRSNETDGLSATDTALEAVDVVVTFLKGPAAEEMSPNLRSSLHRAVQPIVKWYNELA